MLQQLMKYIRYHPGSWPIDLRIEDQLTPLFRFNKEANNVVENEKIGIVIFWFAGDDREPCLVTKIMDSSLSGEYIKSCADRQHEINKNIGVPVFQIIYDITEICGHPVVFQESINKPTYEMELSRAIYGPHGNLALLKKVVTRHFKEMAYLFTQFKMIDTSEESLKWGDWAYSVGEDFRSNYGLRVEILSDDCLQRMRNEINSMSLQRNYVLLDHYCANYFAGPRVVDQIDRSLTMRMSNEPGIIDVFRFIIAYFRTSPICAVYKDWLDAIAFSIMDREGLTVTGLPLRGLLHEIGLNSDKLEKIWSLVMASFFLRCIDELSFYRQDISMISRLRIDFERLTKRLIEIQYSIEKNRMSDVSFILLDEDSFNHRSKFLPQTPYLEEEGYKGFNIVFYRDNYYALSQSLGPVDLTQMEENKIKEYQETGNYFVGESIREVKQFVDQQQSLWLRIVRKIKRI